MGTPSPVSTDIQHGHASMMKLTKEQAIWAKDVVSSVSAKIGGVMGAFAPGQFLEERCKYPTLNVL